MSVPQSRFEHALEELRELPPPPMSPALESLVREVRPVSRRRQPMRALFAVLLASLAVVAIHVYTYDLRHDFAVLPKGWFWSMAVAWLLAFAAPLTVALLPRRGAMIADVRVARFCAFAIPALAITLAVGLRVDVPLATFIPQTWARQLADIEWCIVSGLEMSAVPFAIGILAIRAAPRAISTRWIGAALGAANGALAGLMLHFHCWIGGNLHAGVAHAGHAVLGAILGALLVPTLTERSE